MQSVPVDIVMVGLHVLFNGFFNEEFDLDHSTHSFEGYVSVLPVLDLHGRGGFDEHTVEPAILFSPEINWVGAIHLFSNSSSVESRLVSVENGVNSVLEQEFALSLAKTEGFVSVDGCCEFP